MKKIMAFLLLSIFFCIEPALSLSPFWVGSVYNHNLGVMVPNVMNFDWSSSGSGNAENLGPKLTADSVGKTFNFRYQSVLTALNDPDGNIIDFPGLNFDYEYTLVILMPQKVVSKISNVARWQILYLP